LRPVVARQLPDGACLYSAVVDRRRSRRWPRQLDVRFTKRGEEGPAVQAVSTNVSKTGLFLRTQQVLPTGTRLRLEVNCAGRSFVAEGVVMRALRTPTHLQAAMPSGMGVRFLRVEELLEELLPGINLLAEERVPGSEPQPAHAATAPAPTASYATPPPRPAPASPSPTASYAPPAPAARPPAAGPAIGGVVYPLRFADQEQFQVAFARDIQTGGLFVATPDPPPIDTVVVVAVSVVGSPRPAVRLQARVVHRLEHAGGAMPAGVGVQFLDVARAVEDLRVLLG
jgi:Tfp pilus assembly protein PilZ